MIEDTLLYLHLLYHPSFLLIPIQAHLFSILGSRDFIKAICLNNNTCHSVEELLTSRKRNYDFIIVLSKTHRDKHFLKRKLNQLLISSSMTIYN